MISSYFPTLSSRNSAVPHQMDLDSSCAPRVNFSQPNAPQDLFHQEGVKDPDEDNYEKFGLIKTDNKLGWMSIKLDKISSEFVNYSKLSLNPVLDIGTAFGYIPDQLLKSRVHVIANDIHKPHLDFLSSQTPDQFKSYLTMNTDCFPSETEFAPNSIGAVLASRVFHFLTGNELEIGVKKIFKWLAPGGKVFVLTNAPYRKNMKEFIVEYEEKKKTEKYPGMVKDLKSVNQDQGKYVQETFFHYMDKDVLGKLFLDAGFRIEELCYVKIDLPKGIALDGRENVGIIAVKPIPSKL